ncbi:amino acid ABC transporter permease [Clostridia bacterium]|nr:amino acid ABC transporter permease [Clostridia bacterium]
MYLGISILWDGNNLGRLLLGLWEAIKIAGVSLGFGIILGTFFGVIRTFPSSLIRIIFRIYLEIFRIIPLLVLLYVFYYILPENFNIDLPNQLVSVLVFILWISAEMSEIIRSSLMSVSKHQIESGKALGFNRLQLYQYVYFPQGIKSAIPSMINLVTRVIKTTSLLMMIGVTEVIRVGQQMIEHYAVTISTAPLWIYGFIFMLYFIVCFPLNMAAKFWERRIGG